MQSLSWTSVKPVGGVCPEAGSSFRPIHASSGVLAVETVVVGNAVPDPLAAWSMASKGSPMVAAPETAMACADDHRPPLQEKL